MVTGSQSRWADVVGHVVGKECCWKDRRAQMVWGPDLQAEHGPSPCSALRTYSGRVERF